MDAQGENCAFTGTVMAASANPATIHCFMLAPT
jgi:hypothetical protein